MIKQVLLKSQASHMPDIPSIAGCIQNGKGRLGRKGAATSSTFKSWLLFLSNCHTSGRWRTGPTLRGSSSPWASSGRQEWPLLGTASPVVPLRGQQEPSHRLGCFCLPRAHKTGPGQISAGTPVPGMSPKKHTSQQALSLMSSACGERHLLQAHLLCIWQE